jgi:hypothetical protein
MTTLELYRKHKNGDISREKFLYEVRRDNNLPFITNLTSYDDAVKILKNRGIVTEGETKEAKADEAVKAEVKAKKPSEKKPNILHIDQANPYEYRHGLQYELNELDEYTDEALEKAKTTVLKNLAKDVNFYSNLLNAKQSSYTFKETETDKPGMQAKADGHLKKEVKKDEKANVQDSLGKKEAGKKKPKGIKVMPDKGITGSEKTIKEGLEEAKKSKYIDVDVEDGVEYPMLNAEVIEAYLKSVIDPKEIDSVDVFMNDEEGFGESSTYFFNDLEDYPEGYEKITDKEVEDWAKMEMSYYLFSSPDEFPVKEIEENIFNTAQMGGVTTSKGTAGYIDSPSPSAEDEFNQLMSKYDWYYEMSDDPRAYDRGSSMDSQLRRLGKQIGIDKAVAMFNAKAPSDRKITNTFFMEAKEDKHAKIKEALKKALKEEDPQLSKLQKDEENTEKALAAILTKKAALLNKPGTQG